MATLSTPYRAPTSKPRYRLVPDPEASWHTRSGTPIYADRPEMSAILARDIYAHASGERRYNGAPRVSVLQHSALVGMLAELAEETPEVVQECYAHDLAEAYTGECMKGLKKLLHFETFEASWECRVRDVLGFSRGQPRPEVKRRIKHFDIRALLIELWFYRHPVLALRIQREPAITPAEKALGLATLVPLPGMDRLNWKRLCRWLPKLREEGPL